jgi:Tfp pilus assembly protein PilX
MNRRHPRKTHGFLVVTSLLFCIVLLLLGMGFMESQASRYKSVVYSGQGSQARALAMAGLEDARVKIQNDATFPPQFTGSADPLNGYSFASESQLVFSYMETYTLSSNVKGSYSVVINATYSSDAYPYQVYQIDSIGILGNTTEPTAVYHMQAEMDTSNGCRHTHVQDDSAP